MIIKLDKVVEKLPPIFMTIYLYLKRSDIGTRMAKGSFWMFTGTAIGKFLVLVAGIIVANLLGKEKYGELGLVRSTINMFTIFGVAGMGMTATKYISEFKNSNKSKVSSIYILTNGFALFTGFLVSLVVFLMAPYLANNTLGAPYLVNEIKLGSLLLFIAVLNSAQLGVLSGFEDFKSIAISTFCASLAELIFMILGAYYYGVIGALIGYGIGYLVTYISCFIFIKGNLNKYLIPISLKKLQTSDLKLLYKFSLPAALSSLMVGPIFWMARTILANSSNGYAELGIYEAADQWKVIILFIPTAISNVLLPILSNTISEGKHKSYWTALKYNILINASVAFMLASVISIFAKIIMNMYGDDFNEVSTLILVSFSTVFTSIASVVGIAIASKGQMWVGFLFNSLWAIMFIYMTKLFISLDMGAFGLALALFCSYMLHTLFQLIYLLKLEKRVYGKKNY